MSIADSTLSVDVFTEIRTLIVAAAPYVTNSTTSLTTAASIRAAYHDQEPSRPQIIMNPILSSESLDKFGGTEGKKLINVTVDCYYSNSLGVDQLYDQVCNTIKSNTVAGIELVGLTTDVAIPTVPGNKFHMKSVTFSFDRE